MVYYFISDNEQHIGEIVSKLDFVNKKNGKEYLTFNTSKYCYGFIQLISEIWKQYIENPDAVFIINTELKFTESDERAKYIGVECAMALRLMNKFRYEKEIFLFGYSPQSFIEKTTERCFETFGFVYQQLPFEDEILSCSIKTISNSKNINYSELPEYHLIGLLDDHFDHFDRKIEATLNYYSSDICNIISYPYSLNKSLNENFPDIKKWLACHDILDLFLLDLNYEKIGNHSSTSTQDTDKQGLNVLHYIDSIGYQTPVAILSVSKDVEVIKNITLGYHQLINDFIPTESITNSHSKIDIKNIDNVVKAIIKCLKDAGAKRNKLGILFTHGTDTMAWTLSLLHYSLKLPKCNIVLTGSQIPLKAEFSPSDAPANIIAALYYLNQFVPPQIGVSFDMGKKFFNNNLKKVRIWNENAFDGQVNAQFNWQDIETNHKTLLFNNCLDKLLLLTTGGTIAMRSGPCSTGRPDASAMEKFFDSYEAKYRVPESAKFPFYKDFEPLSIVNIDSSEMNPDVYIKILKTLIDLNNKFDFAEKVESDFRWDVYPIQCSPFMREEDYYIYTKHYKTVDDKGNVAITKSNPIVYVLLGYGAGNLPFKSNEDKNQ
ncbi:MAG: asparaginase domain-containing protein, partial [Candidatus Cloacimonetes bacterium]|nr:asparaginase domain-containing protein [Candidatus Cloacimonadota bacterium]